MLVLVEGWGAAGKGSMIGRVIRQIDPPLFLGEFHERAPTEEEQRFPLFAPVHGGHSRGGKVCLFWIPAGWTRW